eukprot:TRINITY_DN1796_c0_g1_i1.p1 TRINITY_DN1796_c0_g1~~TRINITY_DN1796_c0_g1_i1.p1  ORF type:complete len:135 (+),score=36.90 TRINITY_DN1796_c0_g1_i1:96-500(+)
MPSLVGSEMCIRDRYQRRVHGPINKQEGTNHKNEEELETTTQIQKIQKKYSENQTQNPKHKEDNTCFSPIQNNYQQYARTNSYTNGPLKRPSKKENSKLFITQFKGEKFNSNNYSNSNNNNNNYGNSNLSLIHI